MSYLDVAGARLYFETTGNGPLLVLIPGASGVADSFRPLAAQLASQYTVILYDRRGFSRSQAAQPPDERRLHTDADADDVRRLVEHAGDVPAIVFGASSGAVVALSVLADHPSVVRTVVAHEPPAVRLLPDGQQWLDFFHDVYDLYRREGVDAALARFREHTFTAADADALSHAPRNPANATWWLEHELRQYPAVELDLATLRRYGDRILPAAGRGSAGSVTHRATTALAGALGRPVVDLADGHIGFLTEPAAFAHDLLAALRPLNVPGAAR